MPERSFDFKIKIIQTDLFPRENFNGYFRNLNDSNIPFMVQHSDYIKKLHFMNNFGGAVLSEETMKTENINTEEQFEDRVFQTDIANPEVLAEAERKKDNMIMDMITSGVSPETLMKDLLEKLTETTDEWEFENFDIMGSLFMFDLIHGTNNFNGSNEEFEEFEEFDEIYDDEFDEENEFGEEYAGEFEEDQNSDFGGKIEIKFNAAGSIKFLENNILEIKYDESEMTGIKNAFIRFLFNCDKKDFITIHRCNHLDTWINCKKGERISDVSKSRGAGNSTTVDTKEIINNMTPDGGQLFISYIREANGIPSEMVTHIISASPAREQ